jgi:hypothetical protein
MKDFEREHSVRRISVSGYINIRVNDENGPIKPGDPLGISSISGEARRAGPHDVVIGMARASFPPKKDAKPVGPGSPASEVTGKTNEPIDSLDMVASSTTAEAAASDTPQVQPESGTVTISHGLVEAVIGNGAGLAAANILHSQGLTSARVEGETQAAAGEVLSSGRPRNIEQLVVRDVASFHGEIRVKAHAYWNEDMAGLAKFLKGSTDVRVYFKEPYSIAPIVTVAPRGDIPTNWWVDSETAEGFVVHVRQPSWEKDYEFAWHALAVSEPQLFVSDGTHGEADKEYIWRDTGTPESLRYRDLRYRDYVAPPTASDDSATNNDNPSSDQGTENAEPGSGDAGQGTGDGAPAGETPSEPAAPAETPAENPPPQPEAPQSDVSLPGRTGFDAVGGSDEEILVPFVAFTRG